jgi:hypothetical protein
MKISDQVMRFLLFNEGSDEDIDAIRKALDPFNLFVFVLHVSSIHLDFDEKLNDTLRRLDLISDEHLAFLAFVELDDDMIERLNTREYHKVVQSWMEKLSPSGSKSHEHERIVTEIAQHLDIPFESLPCIVVTNNIRAKQKRYYKTSTETIDEQLYQLGLIARDYPDIKTNWKYAGHVLKRHKQRIDLCNDCGVKFLTKEDLSLALNEVLGNVGFNKGLIDEAQDKKIDFKSLHLLPSEKQYAFLKEDKIYRIIFAGNTVGAFTGIGFYYLYYLVLNKGKKYTHKSLYKIIHPDPDRSQNPKDLNLLGTTDNSSDEKKYHDFDNIYEKEYKLLSADSKTFRDIEKYKDTLIERLEVAKDRGDFDSEEEIQKEIERVEGHLESYDKEYKEAKKGADTKIDAVGTAISRALIKIKNKEVVKHFDRALNKIYSPYGLCYEPHFDIEWITE